MGNTRWRAVQRRRTKDVETVMKWIAIPPAIVIAFVFWLVKRKK